MTRPIAAIGFAPADVPGRPRAARGPAPAPAA